MKKIIFFVLIVIQAFISNAQPKITFLAENVIGINYINSKIEGNKKLIKVNSPINNSIGLGIHFKTNKRFVLRSTLSYYFKPQTISVNYPEYFSGINKTVNYRSNNDNLVFRISPNYIFSFVNGNKLELGVSALFNYSLKYTEKVDKYFESYIDATGNENKHLNAIVYSKLGTNINKGKIVFKGVAHLTYEFKNAISHNKHLRLGIEYSALNNLFFDTPISNTNQLYVNTFDANESERVLKDKASFRDLNSYFGLLLGLRF